MNLQDFIKARFRIILLILSMVFFCGIFLSASVRLKSAIEQRELRVYERLLTRTRFFEASVSSYFNDVRLASFHSDYASESLGNIGIQTIQSDVENPLQLPINGIMSIKVGKISRFEGRLANGKFLSATAIGLRVFPSPGDPVVTLLPKNLGSIILMISGPSSITFLNMPLSLIRESVQFLKNDDKKTGWAIGYIKSIWHENEKKESNSSDAESNFVTLIDRDLVERFSSNEARESLKTLTDGPPRVIRASSYGFFNKKFDSAAN